MSMTMTHHGVKGGSSFANKIASALQKPMSVMGLVTSVKPEVKKGKSIWHIFMADGKRLVSGNPAIAQALGATGAGVPRVPVDLKIVQKGNVSVVVAAQIAGEQARRRTAVDLTNPEFINKIAEADASFVASTVNSAIRNMARTAASINATNAYSAWKARTDEGSRVWRQRLMDVIKQQKVVAEEAVRRNETGFFIKRLCNLGMNSLSCAPAEMERSDAPVFLGSMVVGQLNDMVPESRFNTAISVAWGAYLTIGRVVGPSARKDQQVIADMIARSAVTNNAATRQNELIGALTWAWQTLRAKQPDMGKHRYNGAIGGALQNIETTIQWIGGDIPDLGPLAGVPKTFGNTPEKEFVRAIAIQKARGVPIVEVGKSGDGYAIGRSQNREQTVFGKDGSAKVVASDGTVIFEGGNDEPAPSGPRM
jgi:hypothetical protein